MDSLELSFDAGRLDVGAIHRFLSTEAYWCLGIPRATVERAIAHSLCIGAYRNAEQVDSRVSSRTARRSAISPTSSSSDPSAAAGSRPAWHGRCSEHDDVQDLRRTLLFTADAHALYATLGFAPLARPERGMEIVRHDLYRTGA